MYGNYRNYYLDYANRQAAQNNFMDAMESGRRAQQAAAEYDRNAMAAPGFMGSRSPSGPVGHMAHNHAGRFWQQNENQYANMGNMAMQNAMNNEAAQVQDRSADMQENVIAAKRARDQMEYQAELSRQMARQKMLSNVMSGLSDDGPEVASIDAKVPDVNIYSNGGKRIGGSSIGKSLLS